MIMRKVQTLVNVMISLAVVWIMDDCQAQSAVHIGSNLEAQSCHQLAEQAVTFNAAHISDIAVCERALELNLTTSRDLAATLVNYGIVLLANGQSDKAEQAYQRALALNENLGETYINIANVYLLREQYLKAAQTYSKGLPLMERRQHVAYLNRGLAYEYLGKFDLAVEDYHQALVLSPDWLRAKKMLARAQHKQSKLQEEADTP